MKTLIFEKPSLAPLPNRMGWAFFTAFFWILWIYLWMPLFALAMWVLGFNVFSEYFLHNSKSQIVDLKHLFVLYLSVIVVLGGSLLGWARTEFTRFHNVSRRLQPLPTEVEELAGFAQIPTAALMELNSGRRMVAHHDNCGKFLYAEISF